jgi:hypothetical protein
MVRNHFKTRQGSVELTPIYTSSYTTIYQVHTNRFFVIISMTTTKLIEWGSISLLDQRAVMKVVAEFDQKIEFRVLDSAAQESRGATTAKAATAGTSIPAANVTRNRRTAIDSGPRCCLGLIHPEFLRIHAIIL